MKTKTVTVREGELLGPVDWTFDFWKQFGGLYPSTPEAKRREICAERVEWLRTIEFALQGRHIIMASDYGGWPRIWQPVWSVGMYDGWPYWKPVPSVQLGGPYGGEWCAFTSLTGILRQGGLSQGESPNQERRDV